MTKRWIVLLNTGSGRPHAYGPIEDPDLARKFAEFLTKEVDPAVHIQLIDPMDELLAFTANNPAARPIGWPPQGGDVWQDRDGNRWVCARTAHSHPYLVCLAQQADDSAEEIWRLFGPMTHVSHVSPTAGEEVPF